MPVPVDALLRGEAPTASGNPGRVLKVLRKEPRMAWRAVELASKMKVDQHTLGAVLRRLRVRGLVDKKEEYWFVPTEQDAARLSMLHALTRDLNQRLGPEDPADWPHEEQT